MTSLSSFYQICKKWINGYGASPIISQTLVHIFMRISWRTRICKNIPRPWRPWPTGEMVYCECGTTNKKQGEYLEAGGEGVVGGEQPQDIHRASRWASHILAYE